MSAIAIKSAAFRETFRVPFCHSSCASAASKASRKYESGSRGLMLLEARVSTRRGSAFSPSLVHAPPPPAIPEETQRQLGGAGDAARAGQGLRGGGVSVGGGGSQVVQGVESVSVWAARPTD